MKVRFPLYLQTFAMLVLYLGTLVVIIFCCFNARFGIGWEAALQSPLGEKFETIAGAVSSQLHASKPEHWQAVLKNFEDHYHVKFYVFDMAGKELAGDTIELPPPVAARINTLPPPPPMPPFFNMAWGHGPGHMGPAPSPDHIGPGHLVSGHLGPGPGENFIASVGPEFRPGPEFGTGPQFRTGRQFRTGPEFRPGPDLRMAEQPAIFFMQTHGRFLVHTTNPDRFWICARIHVLNPQMGFAGPGTLIAACDNLWQTSLLFDFQFVASIFAIVLGLSLVFWWPFIFRITRALSRLTAATESIALGKFDTRIKSQGNDEIGHLSQAVDTMAERLEGYVQEQKRLLADISHELFSPLARLQLALALLEGNSTKDQQGHIKDIKEEVDEMNNLVSELIAYSKAGMQAKTPDLTAINLKGLVESLVPRVSENKIVDIDLPAEITVKADKLLLDRAISNVLRNSVRYAGDAGPIKVRAVAEGPTVTLSIGDSGPGVSEEALKHLAEPFYRPEPSRNRSLGGFGLGLAIVKSCVEACQGKLIVRNGEAGGLHVEIQLQAAD